MDSCLNLNSLYPELLPSEEVIENKCSISFLWLPQKYGL